MGSDTRGPENIHPDLPDLADLAAPLSTLTPLPGNPRRGDVDAVAKSYSAFGQRKPVVARRMPDGSGVVIAGNHQLAAATQLGWAEIAVVWTDDDDATAEAFALADNRTADLGTYDDGLLFEMIERVREANADLLTSTGYNAVDLEAMSPKAAVARTDPDAVPDAPKVARTVPGDVWLLGEHRVMCGSSTDPNSVAKLMDGGSADIVWTDPPYGIAYRAMRGGSPIANDGDAFDAEAVTTEALRLAPAEAHFVCCDWRSLPTITRAMTGAGLEPKACIVWDKKVRVQNLDRFAKRHEMIIYSGPFGGQPTVDTDVWDVARDFDPDHPTPKPVELVTRAISHASSAGAIVLDLFGGSGSAVIACHQTGRIARLMELDPVYVDVICRRYQEHTGDKPILELTGEPHDFTEVAP